MDLNLDSQHIPFTKAIKSRALIYRPQFSGHTQVVQ